MVTISNNSIPATIPSPPPVLLNDIDDMMKRLADDLPYIGSEAVYLSELSAQTRIYTVILVLGFMMLIFSALI